MVHSELISKFETLMRIYIDKHCLSVNQFIPCEQPELRFGSASGLYDIPTTTNNGGGGGGGGGDGGHGTPAPSHDSSDPLCAGVQCRGKMVCNNGVCERGSGGGSESCPTECCVDGDCRGPKVCNTEGVCERMSRGGGRGGILEKQDVVEEKLEDALPEEETQEEVADDEEDAVDEQAVDDEESIEDEATADDEQEVEAVEENESVDEEMAFNGAFSAETAEGFSLQNATVNVSTVLALCVMAMAVMIGRNCFWKMYGGKKVAAEGGAVQYGSVNTV